MDSALCTKNTMLSIVMVTYNRAHLLERSLQVYAAQPYKDFELIVVDDDSTDNTQELLKEYARQMDIKSIIVRKRPGLWRDCARNINLGLRAAKGDFVVATHPEVIPGWLTLEHTAAAARDEVYVASKIYYLSRSEQERLDTVAWRENPLAVRELEGFYTSPSINGMPEYSHAAMDSHTEWQSWVFGGMSRNTWRRIGGMTEFDDWGVIDMDFQMRRYLLNIKTETLMNENTICIHQNHDNPEKDVLTPRDVEAAHAALPVYRSPEEAIHNHI
jgi:glycosyltransferase involved in cell wall biosynthesis